VLGEQRVEMRLWDTGVRLYANVYYATVQTLKTKADVLAKFVRATARGWEVAHRHRERAVDSVVQEFPIRNRKDELDVADVILRYAFGPNTKRSGWGAMERALWQEQIDVFGGLKQFPNRAQKVEEVMTLELLEATAGARPKIG
jgi:NitT/TauT family transport system substrate-binding protein